MNYLGHLYFSDSNTELMYANIYGDFVKGSNLSMHSTIVQKGVVLHRKIDDFIDTHPIINDLKKELSPLLPKIYGIAIDLYFDHWLAKNWSLHHNVELSVFIEEFYSANHYSKQFTNQNYQFLIAKMREDDWLNQYKTIDGLNFAATGLSRRISFENTLWKAKEVYIEKEGLIESSLEKFMVEAKIFFQTK